MARQVTHVKLTEFIAALNVPIVGVFTALRRLEHSCNNQLNLLQDREREMQKDLVPVLRRLPFLYHLSLVSQQGEVRLSSSWTLSGTWPALQSLHFERKVLNAEIPFFITSLHYCLESLSIKLPTRSETHHHSEKIPPGHVFKDLLRSSFSSSRCGRRLLFNL